MWQAERYGCRRVSGGCGWQMAGDVETRGRRGWTVEATRVAAKRMTCVARDADGGEMPVLARVELSDERQWAKGLNVGKYRIRKVAVLREWDVSI